MKKSFLMACVLTSVFWAGLAGAAEKNDTDDHSACKGEEGWLPQNMLLDGLAQKGYTVKQMRMEHGCLEVDAVNEKGQAYELIVHPSSGKILNAEQE